MDSVVLFIAEILCQPYIMDFPILQTNRLLLREICIDDANDIIALRSNAETLQYIPRPLITTLAQAQELIDTYSHDFSQQKSITWAITQKNDDRFIGSIGFVKITPENNRGELGYALNPTFQGKGLMSEAVARVIIFGFEVLNFHKIEAVIDPRNIASQKVLEKANFIKEGLLKDNVFFNNAYADSQFYGLLKSALNN